MQVVSSSLVDALDCLESAEGLDGLPATHIYFFVEDQMDLIYLAILTGVTHENP